MFKKPPWNKQLAPKKGSHPKRKGSSSKHPFLDAILVSCLEVGVVGWRMKNCYNQLPSKSLSWFRMFLMKQWVIYTPEVHKYNLKISPWKRQKKQNYTWNSHFYPFLGSIRSTSGRCTPPCDNPRKPPVTEKQDSLASIKAMAPWAVQIGGVRGSSIFQTRNVWYICTIIYLHERLNCVVNVGKKWKLYHTCECLGCKR